MQTYHMTQTRFSRISTFTRFKLPDDTGPFVKVGQNTYDNNSGAIIEISPSASVFQVLDKYEG